MRGGRRRAILRRLKERGGVKTVLQALKHGAHAGRPIDGAGQSADASGLPAGDPVAEGTGPVDSHDAPSTRGEANGLPGAAQVVRVISEFSL